MKYLVIDTESGGTDSNLCDILTAYFAVFSSDGDLIDELELWIKPDIFSYRIQPGSLDVNGIDLVNHWNRSEPKTKCFNKLKQFLKKNCQKSIYAGKVELERLILLGQQVLGDVELIYQFFPQENWEHFVSNKYLDTLVIANFLQDSNKLQVGSLSLDSLAEYFGIEYKAHDAKEDALATFNVYKKLKSLI